MMSMEAMNVMYDSWDTGMWAWMLVLMVLVVGAIVGVILVVLRLPGRDERPPTSETSVGALDVLDERFARGEIDTDEYAERRRVLTEPHDRTRV
jgi:putative membrane protein